MPGKFEGNENEEIAEQLSGMTPDEEAGDVSEMGMWSGIFRGIEIWIDPIKVKGDMPGGYIVQEDEQGFFTYTEFQADEELEKAWEWILEQEEKFYEGVEDE